MKKIKYIILVFLSTLYLFAASRDSDQDSLKSVIKTSTEDTFRVKNLNSLSATYFGTEPSEALRYALQARGLSEKLGYMEGLAQSLKNIGIAHYVQGNYVEALDYWKQSMAVFDTIGNDAGVANMLSNIGALHFNQSDDANALEYYFKSLKLSEKIADPLRIVTALVNIGAVYYNKSATHDKALKYYLEAMPLAENLGDKDAIGTCSVNLGELYLELGDDKSALYYFERARMAYQGSANLPSSLTFIGKVYTKRGEFGKALKYQVESFGIAKKLDSKLDMAQSLLGMAATYDQMGDTRSALVSFLKAKDLALEIGANKELKTIYEGLASSYSRLSDFKNAFKYQTLYASIKDTIYNIETDKKLSGLLFNFEMEKKQGEIDLLTKDKALQELDLERQKLTKNALSIGLILIIFIAVIIFRNYRIKVRTNKVLDRQKEEIEGLLLNILPLEVARELQRDGYATPRYYESASVLFTDFKGFTTIAEGLSPENLVQQLNRIFSAFDDIIHKHNLEKIKTIGDAYMCAGGIPSPNNTHPFNIINAGLELQEYMRTMNEMRIKDGLFTWELRIGVHTGPLVAGVVGKKKYAYDIWGSTVNIASRMESNGEPGRVNISESTYKIIQDQYPCSYRGKIYAKNIGDIDMYFVDA